MRSPLGAAALVRSMGKTIAGTADDARAALVDLVQRRFSAERVVLTASGTDALTLALRHIRSIPGVAQRPVALPAFGCFAIGASAVAAGLPVVLYDVDPRTLGPDWDSLADVVRAGVSGVVIAPQYGVPVDWARVRATVTDPQVVLIEDAAQAQGASWQGRPVGAEGEIGIVSFGRGKGWTGGGGGALLLRGRAAAPPPPTVDGPPGTLRLAVASGLQWMVGRPAFYGIPASLPFLGLGETHYVPAGSPRDMATFSVHLALATAADAVRDATTRRRLVPSVSSELAAVPGLELVHPPHGSDPGWIRLPILREQGLGSPARAAELRRLGVAPSFPLPLAALDPLRGLLAAAPGAVPGAQRLSQTLITLPAHDWLSEAERAQLIRLLRAE